MPEKCFFIKILHYHRVSCLLSSVCVIKLNLEFENATKLPFHGILILSYCIKISNNWKISNTKWKTTLNVSYVVIQNNCFLCVQKFTLVQGSNRFILIVKQACLCNFDVVLKLLEPSWKWLEMKQKFECSIQMSNYIHTKESSTYVLSFLEKKSQKSGRFL